MEQDYQHKLTTPEAIRVFVRDATKVASKISGKLCRGKYETLSLFVNIKTGHIRIWCREEDKTALAMASRSDTLFRKMFWQIHGTAGDGVED